MRLFVRLTTLTAVLFLVVWSFPGCNTQEGDGGKMDTGTMPSGKMGGAMEKDKMGGAMPSGNMGGAMEKDKMGGACRAARWVAPWRKIRWAAPWRKTRWNPSERARDERIRPHRFE